MRTTRLAAAGFEGHAVHPGHAQIAHDHVVGPLGEPLEPRVPIVDRISVVAGLLDDRTTNARKSASSSITKTQGPRASVESMR